MKSRKNLIGLVLLIIMALSLAACERSASTAPEPTTDPFPEAATPSMAQVEQLLGTPQGAEEGSQPAAGEGTPQPSESALGELPPLGGESTTEAAAEGTTPAAGDEPTPVVIAPQPVVVEAARPATYILQKGEFPYCIARRYNLDPKSLMSLNGLSLASSQQLQPGLVLQIPQTGTFGTERALLPHPSSHTVQSGDTIYSIACKYGDVDPMNIVNFNALAAPYTLTVGTVLQIP